MGKNVKKTFPGVGEILWTVFLGVLVGLTGWLGFSSVGLQWLGSRAQVYCVVALVFLLLLWTLRLVALFRGHRTAYVRWDFLIFLVPFVLIPLAGSPNGGASVAEAKPRMAVSVPVVKVSAVVPGPTGTPTLADTAKPTSKSSGKTEKKVEPALPSVKPVQAAKVPSLPDLVFNKDNFEDLYDEISGAAEKYKGRKVVLDGFVLPSETVQPGRFSLGRLLITCCPADGVFMGFDAVQAPGARGPEKDSWWHFEGEVEPAVEDGVTVALLKVSKMEPVAVPADPYVYQH